MSPASYRTAPPRVGDYYCSPPLHLLQTDSGDLGHGEASDSAREVGIGRNGKGEGTSETRAGFQVLRKLRSQAAGLGSQGPVPGLAGRRLRLTESRAGPDGPGSRLQAAAPGSRWQGTAPHRNDVDAGPSFTFQAGAPESRLPLSAGSQSADFRTQHCRSTVEPQDAGAAVPGVPLPEPEAPFPAGEPAPEVPLPAGEEAAPPESSSSAASAASSAASSAFWDSP